MLVKDIIILACDFTENQDLGKALEENSTLTDEQTKLCDSLVKCFNLVNSEIASDFVPLLKNDELKTKDFRVNFSEFTFVPSQIYSVKDKGGRNVKFKVFDNYLIAFANMVNVAYTTLPGDMALTSEFTTTLPERIYAYGVAREFYFLQSLFDDADIWEARFKDALQSYCRKKSGVVMPKRRWL